MKDGKKIKLEDHENALDSAGNLSERIIHVITDWVATLTALTCVIMCIPFFVLIDLYRWFKFKILRKE
tara:strand:+ start:83 stop:286 length:204 start_codon:yes stop_codon:yes gene_type:complete